MLAVVPSVYLTLDANITLFLLMIIMPAPLILAILTLIPSKTLLLTLISLVTIMMNVPLTVAVLLMDVSLYLTLCVYLKMLATMLLATLQLDVFQTTFLPRALGTMSVTFTHAILYTDVVTPLKIAMIMISVPMILVTPKLGAFTNPTTATMITNVPLKPVRMTSVKVLL
jgi:hypothetical protein